MTKHIKKFFASLALLSIELLVLWLLFLSAFLIFLYTAFRVFYFKKEEFDFAVFDFLHNYITDTNTTILNAITFLGTHSFLIPANIILILYFLFIKKHRWYAIKLPVVAIGGVTLMFLLKSLFNRPRPLLPLIKEAQGLSFPSGHALMSVAFYGLLIYIVWHSSFAKWLRITLIALLVLLILVIGFSRIYLRYHYASDVAAGFCMGTIWLLLSLWVTGRMENYSRKKIEPELQAG